MNFKKHQKEIFLFLGVFLISLFSFALGFIVAEERSKEPIKIELQNEESKSSYCWSRNMWSLFSS